MIKKSPTVFTTNQTELIKNGTCLITKPLSLCVNQIAPALGGKIHYLFDVSLYVYQFIVAAFHFPFKCLQRKKRNTHTTVVVVLIFRLLASYLIRIKHIVAMFAKHIAYLLLVPIFHVNYTHVDKSNCSLGIFHIKKYRSITVKAILFWALTVKWLKF